MGGPKAIVLGAFGVLLFALPASASAARIEDRSYFAYIAAPGEANRVTVSLRFTTDLSDATITITDPGAASMSSSHPRCGVSGKTLTCRGIDNVVAELGDRDDTIVFDQSWILDSTTYAGAGNDRITVNSGAAEIHGEGGNDTATGGSCTQWGPYGTRCYLNYHGGPGDDAGSGGQEGGGMYGDDGNDRYAAGTLDSYFAGGPGADAYTGGPAMDTADYFDHVQGVRADADGVTGDDGASGEGDTIGGEVELIQGGEGPDHLDSSGGNHSDALHPNNLFGRGGDDTIFATDGWDEVDGGAGADTIHGLAGQDVLIGEQWDEAGGGDDELHGGPGLDTLYARYGSNLLDGGADEDTLVAGEGDDSLTGGPGADTIDSGGGRDEVFGIDGFVDDVDCGGTSFEVVHLDPEDWVHLDCDSVDYGGRPGIPPRAEVRPDLYGEPVVGADPPLGFHQGRWSGTPYFGDDAFKWLRCDTEGDACVEIDTTGQGYGYTPAAADAGHTLRVRVIRYSKAGSGIAYTCPSGIVAARGGKPGPAPPCDVSGTQPEESPPPTGPGQAPPSGPGAPAGAAGETPSGPAPAGGSGAPGAGAEGGAPGPAALRLVHRVGRTTLRSLARRGLALRGWCSAACRIQARLRVPTWLAAQLGSARLIAVAGTAAPPARSVPLMLRVRPALARRLARLRGATLTLELQAYDDSGALRATASRRMAVRR